MNTKQFKTKLFVLGLSCYGLFSIFSPKASFLPVKAGEIEMLAGDQKLFIDSQSGNLRNIAPDDFNPVFQPPAIMPSNEVSKSFKAMRQKKGKNNFDLFKNDNSGISSFSPILSDCLHRPQVIVSLDQLNNKNNSRLTIARKRLLYYQGLFEKIFAEEGVPQELISIGFVESTFNPSAISPAGARGIWQFIPSTGRIFGLNNQDDFSDPVKSTRAAAKYLKKLHNRFGDWLLAIAAYNAGDTRVQQAINLSNGNKDFWEVSRYLPNETKNYVPRVIAALTVLKQENSAIALPASLSSSNNSSHDDIGVKIID